MPKLGQKYIRFVRKEQKKKQEENFSKAHGWRKIMAKKLIGITDEDKQGSIISKYILNNDTKAKKLSVEKKNILMKMKSIFPSGQAFDNLLAKTSSVQKWNKLNKNLNQIDIRLRKLIANEQYKYKVSIY